ncbi:hypothetical protein GF340_02190 [Candidatus Peregrinibacteria bacterium]|nr:hypothetical protein [Candidatus Peregrinibacteria bacterium]
MSDWLSNEERIIQLLEEQNKLLKKLVHVERGQGRRAWVQFFIKNLPIIILLVVLVYMYFSLQAYLRAINAEISAIQGNVGSVFTLLEDQYSFLSGAFGQVLNTLKSYLPNLTDLQQIDLSGLSELSDQIKSSLF